MSPSDDSDARRSSPPGSSADDGEKAQSRRWTSYVPAWATRTTARDVKVVLRCTVAVWVALLLVFVQPALDNLGIAAFFGAIVLFIVPPANVLTIHLLSVVTVLLGMCLAWAWGLLSMKAALATRSDAETQARFRMLQEEAAARAQSSGLPAAVEAQRLVHDGFMLDVRVTVVFFVMSCVFIYAMARLRCRNPKFAGMQITGTIITDLFIIIGPTLPSFNATMPSLLIKPGAAGIGIGAVCCVLFFPRSTSYAVLEKLESLVRMGQNPVVITRERLASEKVDVQRVKAMRAGMIGLYKAVGPHLSFLPVDFSRCLWTARDITQVHALVRELMLASLSLLTFHVSGIANEAKAEQWTERQRKHDSDEEKSASSIGQHQILERAEIIAALQSPEQGATRTRTLAALQEATSDVLEAISKSISLTADCIRTVNTRRWFNSPSPETLNALRREVASLRDELHVAIRASGVKTTEAILESHADIFDKDGMMINAHGRSPLDLSGIILSMVLEEGILGAGAAVENLMRYVEKLLQVRTRTRIWAPAHLQYAINWIFLSGRSAPSTRSGDDAVDEDDMGTFSEDLSAAQNRARKTYQRLLRGNIKHGSGRQRSVVNRAVVGTWKWLTDPGGMYSLRMVLVTVATCIPAVIPHTAGFYYREKGIWAVITAQTTLLVYMSDFIVAVLARALATVLGGLVGLVAWYMGSGSGHGNPYGLAAATFPAIAVLMWTRLSLPPACASAGILAGATFSLIVGFSYDQHHAPQYGLPGEGYEAFWKRVLLVLVGFAASMVVQMLPTPPSATKHVRQTLADAVRSLSDHYALLLSHWGGRGEGEGTGQSEADQGLAAVAEHISLGLAEKLLGLDAAMATLRFEPSFSPFDARVLRETQDQCQALNQALSRLLSLAATLPAALQRRLVRTSGLTDGRVVGDVMAVLALVEQALRTGCPLPERLPTPLIRRFYEFWQAQQQQAAEGSVLSVELIREEDYRRYCVAVSSYLKFLSALDVLVLALKETLGECYVVDP